MWCYTSRVDINLAYALCDSIKEYTANNEVKFSRSVESWCCWSVTDNKSCI